MKINNFVIGCVKFLRLEQSKVYLCIKMRADKQGEQIHVQCNLSTNPDNPCTELLEHCVHSREIPHLTLLSYGFIRNVGCPPKHNEINALVCRTLAQLAQAPLTQELQTQHNKVLS